MNKIDVRRGVTIRRHKASGMYVYMYKDAPGVYFDAFARPIPESLAAKAGFPVETLKRLKLKKDKVAAFQADLERQLELAAEEDEIIYARAGEFKVVQLPGGTGNLIDGEGNRLNSAPMPLEQAVALMNELAGESEDGGSKEVGGSAKADGADSGKGKGKKGETDGRAQA